MDHINSIDPNIRFTSEDPKDDGSISFLDILIIPEEDGKLNTTVYRKPTHTDLYLHWDSHHTIPSKYSVVGTLYHRANTFCSTPQHLQKEEKHLSQAWSGHSVTIDNSSIVGREDQNLKRAIKEALYIRSNNPSLNKNIGKNHLPHIWDEVLVNISELQLK